jgi:hypothetical protein
MAKKDAVVTFSTERHSKTVAEMRAAGEEVRARGRSTVKKTGKLHPFVDVKLRIKKSRNSIIDESGKLTLVNGPALSILPCYDGTASMGENIGRFFRALVPFYELLTPIRNHYDTQLSAMMFQDRDDTIPDTDLVSAVQQTEFESGNAIAAQIRELINSNNGYDSTEEYQLALLQAAFNLLDINRYGLKGYMFLGGDENGRDGNTPEEVMEHLGRKIQSYMTIKQMYEAAAEKYHVYRIQCGGGGAGASRDSYSVWWERVMGKGHVIVVRNVDLLAEVQAALVWCGETQNPTEEGLIEFIVSGTAGNIHRTSAEAKEIWSWITEAEVELGVQTKLPNWGKLPKKGDIFAHYRHLWPIDDPRAAENVIEVEDEDPPLIVPGTPKRPSGRKAKPIDWDKF